MFKYEYTVALIGIPYPTYRCSVTFVEQQYEEDVVDLIMTNDYHANEKMFIPKHAVSTISNLEGEFLSED